MPKLSVHLLPSLTNADELAGGTVVFIDVLRATTTVVTALAAGAGRVIACQEIDEARGVAARLPPGTALLGGERHGVRIDGFDLGNSPAEYARDTVAGRTIVFTTTNGTRALQVCGRAAAVFPGAFVNLGALCRVLAKGTGPLNLLCAGTGSQITLEDVLFAGAITAKLCESNPDGWQLNDEATTASAAWRDTLRRLGTESPAPEALAAVLRESRGGQNLIATGQDEDIVAAATIDACDVVPYWDAKSGEIRIV